jgi:hypothetical protein
VVVRSDKLGSGMETVEGVNGAKGREENVDIRCYRPWSKQDWLSTLRRIRRYRDIWFLDPICNKRWNCGAGVGS